MPYALKQEIIDKLGDGFLYEVYGSTELGVDTVLKPEDQLRKPGFVRQAVRRHRDPDREGRRHRSPRRASRASCSCAPALAMDGYHHTDEQLTELAGNDDDWKSVGDVAYVDDEGYVYICDRKKDMIISGGVNIYPAEIEAVLYAHPQVLDAAVFGIPDDEWGERVHAIVQAKPGETDRPRRAPRVRRAASRELQAAARVRAARRAAAHRLGQAAQARAARRVLAGPDRVVRSVECARPP